MDEEVEKEENMNINELFVSIDEISNLQKELIKRNVKDDGSIVLTSYLDHDFILTTEKDAVYCRIEHYDNNMNLLSTKEKRVD